jgi:uncharacterized protein (DUF1501 family)
MSHLPLSRRAALLGLASVATLGRSALAVASAPTDKRFVVVLLRGAMDGLAAVTPYGDAALAGLRDALLLAEPGREGGLLDLGGFFGMHPALAELYGMYRAGEALAVHAVAGAWRSRSHFEAQDYLEFGVDHRLTSGWLNRVAGQITPPGAKPGTDAALAMSNAMPLLLRGPAPAVTWLPQSFQQPEPDLYARIAALHTKDEVTGPAIAAALRERGFSEGVLASAEKPANRFSFAALAGAAGKLLAAADGPRLAALEVGGWDTHSAQNARIADPLRQLDAGLAALKTGLGDAWNKTVVLVITEFGRTVRINGTGGSDHGTGAVAFVLGRPVAGGRVLGNWPGLGRDNLLENRDLMPTTDLRSVAKGLLAGHLGLRGAALDRVFPDSDSAAVLRGMLRA